jgi:hypothetical protein
MSSRVGKASIRASIPIPAIRSLRSVTDIRWSGVKHRGGQRSWLPRLLLAELGSFSHSGDLGLGGSALEVIRGHLPGFAILHKLIRNFLALVEATQPSALDG